MTVKTESPRRIVITQFSLFTIAGSEVVTFELAEYFRSVGDDVLIVTFGVSESWRAAFEEVGAAVLRVDDPDLDDRLRRFDPTHVWVQHQLVPPVLVDEAAGRRFIFHHMSIVHPMEFALHHEVETALAGAVVFVSSEAETVHRETGLLAGVPEDRWHVLGNPAPAGFRPPAQDGGRTALLVVSNHPPAELLQAGQSLPAESAVEFVGAHPAGSPRKITPADVAGARAVVSIGKTVQYALASGTPVYCYDHFGGPGWLTPDNFALARHHNFSGRGFERKTAQQIEHELSDGFAEAQKFAEFAVDEYADVLSLPRVIERVLAAAEPVRDVELDPRTRYAYERDLELRNGLINAIEAQRTTAQYWKEHAQLAAATAPATPQSRLQRLWRRARRSFR